MEGSLGAAPRHANDTKFASWLVSQQFAATTLHRLRGGPWKRRAVSFEKTQAPGKRPVLCAIITSIVIIKLNTIILAEMAMVQTTINITNIAATPITVMIIVAILVCSNTFYFQEYLDNIIHLLLFTSIHVFFHPRPPPKNPRSPAAPWRHGPGRRRQCRTATRGRPSSAELRALQAGVGGGDPGGRGCYITLVGVCWG